MASEQTTEIKRRTTTPRWESTKGFTAGPDGRVTFEQVTMIGSITEMVVCSSPLPPCRGEGWALVEERDGCSMWRREVYRRSEAPNA